MLCRLEIDNCHEELKGFIPKLIMIHEIFKQVMYVHLFFLCHETPHQALPKNVTKERKLPYEQRRSEKSADL